MKKAPAHLLRRGIVTEVVPAGVMVRLEGGEMGKVRWRQLFSPDVGREEAHKKAEVWKDSGSPLEFVIIENVAGGLILSRIQALDYPWPDDAFSPSQRRLSIARVVHVTPSYAYGMLNNSAEVRVELGLLYAYLSQHGIPWGKREIHFDDELEGYLYAVDDRGVRVTVPDTNLLLPTLELDVFERLQEYGTRRGISLLATVADSQLRRAARPRCTESASGVRPGLRVLVAIDDPQFLDAFAARLEARGCQVERAADILALERLIERRKAQEWIAEVAFVKLDFPSAELGGRAAGLVDTAFPACRLVILTSRIEDIPDPGVEIRASALLKGMVTDTILDKQLGAERRADALEDQLRPGADRQPWHRLVASEPSAGPADRALSPLRTKPDDHNELQRLLEELMGATRSTKGAFIRMHPAKKAAEIIANKGYATQEQLDAADRSHLVPVSCIGDVLLHRMEYAPANECGQDPAHTNHVQIVGRYKALIALPIEVFGPHRYGLFLLDPTPATLGARPAFLTKDIDCARALSHKISSAISRCTLKEHLRFRSGLMRAGLMSVSIWHDVVKLLETVRGEADKLLTACDQTKTKARDVAMPLAKLIARLHTTTGEALASALPGRTQERISVVEAVEAAIASAENWRNEKGLSGLAIELAQVTGSPVTYECNGNRIRLERAVLNLVINALEQMSEFIGTEGRVSVTVEIGPTSENVRKELRSRVSTSGSPLPIYSAVISVTDTGCGIPGYLREDIFQPLFSTKELPDGVPSGLGLTIASSLVEEDLSGILYVASAPRFIGATFRIVLPAQRTHTEK